MAKQITIENVKQIDQLIFDIPGPGVHILCGTNGVREKALS